MTRRETRALRFEVATGERERALIRELNYATFVEEIPQHAPDPGRTLADPFDAENTYLVALDGDRLAGMVAVRDRRPFSLDRKLPDLDRRLPPARSIVEIRLLAVRPEYRRGAVFRGLARELTRLIAERGWDLAVISGSVRELGLYRRLGFVPFGPRVGTPGAKYQPMYATARDFFGGAARLLLPRPARERPVNLLPGPVELAPEVRSALAAAPLSHRSEAFDRELSETRRLLRALTGARHVQVLLGSGTLANDHVAAQLSLLDAPGLVLSNGEFGERLIDHAARCGLRFETVRAPWGEGLEPAAVESAAAELPPGGWIWAVHCETSTGALNDADALGALARRRGLRLCLDCISSLGTAPVALGAVHLATGASGKGLGAYPGLSIVFHDHEVAPSDRLPRYLDLGLWAGAGGVPFTHSSNLVGALRAALERHRTRDLPAERAASARWLWDRLGELGFRLLDPPQPSPAVLTVALPDHLDSGAIGSALADAGYLASYNSGYLLERNWLQFCFMGEHRREEVAGLPSLLEALCAAP